MSHDPSFPHPLLDLDAQALLERAYSLRGDSESRALYRDWAMTYDQTMVDGLQYRSPKVVEWDAMGFSAKIAALAENGALRVHSAAPDRLYANSPEPDGMMCLVWRL